MIEGTVRYVYELLLEKKYKELEEFTDSKRLSAYEIRYSIEEYGFQLIQYPNEIKLDVIEVTGSNPKEWSVVAPIYTDEEGMSDLSIELSVIDNGKKLYRTELDNIRVR
jgi:hypothetical protein